MQRARFLEHQEPVIVSHIEGDTWFTICLNETIETNSYDFTDGETHTITEYVYDFNQFKDNSLDEEDVIEHPEEYINYTPKVVEPVTPVNIEERVADLEMRQAVSEQALQDVILMATGGE